MEAVRPLIEVRWGVLRGVVCRIEVQVLCVSGLDRVFKVAYKV